jgi:endonuclease/exonuclease/phosphatase family metal-dependent hydrolase
MGNAEFKLVTYNTKWFFDTLTKKNRLTNLKIMDHNQKAKLIAEKLSNVKADIIILQEIDGYDDVNAPKNLVNNYNDVYNKTCVRCSYVLYLLCKELENKTGIKYYYVVSNKDMIGQRVGILFNAKLYSRTFSFGSIEKSVGSRRRICAVKNIWINFTFKDQEYTVLGVHLKSKLNFNPGKVNTRTIQALEIQQFLDGHKNKNVILAGDFNMSDDSLGQKDDPDQDIFKIIKLVNTWSLYNKLTGGSIQDIETHFYDKDRDKKVDKGELSILDTVLVNDNLVTKIKNIQTIGNLTIKDNVDDVSDHLAVVCTIRQ